MGKKIRNLLKRARILWLGPQGTGKTALLNHLASPDLYTKITSTHGLETPKIPSLGKAKIAVSDLSSSNKQADLVKQFRPTILIVQIAIDEESSEPWLREFLDKFVEVLIVNPEKVAELRRILFIVAKADKVSEKVAEQNLSRISQVIDEHFKPVFDKRPKQVEILLCSLIQKQEYHTRRIMNYMMSGSQLDPITHRPAEGSL
ncbi:hypothetical protein ES703_65029 [subsurface metagenome]